ncbi:EAL domain-containing protein [Bacillus sp. HMF5848]|uniref:EAL domain-containing protein n=1 Tax=Bacillus sp. HMF5848 TaxID=2495421 RepID=UPI000F7AFA36|nr:EAL domain-containing protein [Bacillus sp. HMF5848]RSK26507.1 EAL domain-containing protein [Bacillus sp. HMF5848]
MQDTILQHPDLVAIHELSHLLNTKNILSIFQPIISLKTAEPFAFEALSRGPVTSPLHYPSALFSTAERCNQLYTLEKVCREKAIETAQSFLNNKVLFLNISSQVIHDPSFTPGHTVKLLNEFNIQPHQVVFEITERSAIEDFTAFREVLHHYRAQGFQVAIDDAGAGYSSLQAISELTPEYIKVDRSLICDVHKNEIKLGILEAFVTFAKRMNSKVIAEGIETIEELEVVLQLGIEYGQGYLFAYPNYPVASVSTNAKRAIQTFHNSPHQNSSRTIIVKENDKLLIVGNGSSPKSMYVKDIINQCVLI